MRLIALLSWYDEPAWCLTELVASLADAGVDHLVAVDGAYALFPEGRAQSPGEQAQALIAAAQGAGLGVTMHRPRDVWFGNEIEKRTFMFAAGHLIAEPGEDWFWVVDGDEVVTEALGVREALEGTDLDAGEVLLELNAGAGPEGVHPVRMLFRAQPAGIWVEHNHFRYVTDYEPSPFSGGPVTRLLWNGYCQPTPDLVDAETMHFVRVHHREGVRTAIRDANMDRYSERRNAAGAEMVPG